MLNSVCTYVDILVYYAWCPENLTPHHLHRDLMNAPHSASFDVQEKTERKGWVCSDQTNLISVFSYLISHYRGD